jgi:2-methylcitrate dehydratase PrpD
VRGSAGLDAFAEAALHDPAIATLRRRVQVAEDPELTKLVPRLKPARVTVRLRDGRSATRACEASRGGFDRPYERDEVLVKFRELAGQVLTPEGVAETEAAVERFDQITDVGDFVARLRRLSR